MKSTGSARATRRNAVSSSSAPAHAEPPAPRAAKPARKLDGAAARPLSPTNAASAKPQGRTRDD
ncbi:hypothetical protein AAHH79_36165, partial [Burkholderia pseudomallei]